AVPITELDNDVARIQDQFALVEDEDPLALEEDPVIDRRRFMDGRAEGVLSAAIPSASLPLPRRMKRHRGRVLGRVVILGPRRGLDDPKMPALIRRLEMER